MTSLILFVLKENKRRILSWMCFICMLFNTLPVASFASEFEGDLTEPVEVVQDVMPDDSDPVVPAAQVPADPVDSQDPSDPPADATDGEEPAADDHDDPQSEPAAEESNIIPDNSADIVPDVDVLEPDTNDIVPEGQDVPSAEEVVLPSLFIDFPATGVFSGDTLSVIYKYTSAKNEELVIDLDNIALGLEVKYLSDEVPVDTVRTEDEETGHAYYRLSALKDEVYMIRVFVEKADEEIPYSITITEYVEPSADVEPEVQDIEPDNTGDALIDIPPEITDNGTDETGDTTDTEPESNVVDIFPDLPNNEDTSAFDNFLNGNTEPAEETPAEENDEDKQEPDEDIVPVEPTNEEVPDENTAPVEPEGQVSEDTEEPVADEPTVEEPDVEPEDNNIEEDVDNEPQDAENPTSDAILPDILPDAENGENDAFGGLLDENEDEPVAADDNDSHEDLIDKVAEDNTAEDGDDDLEDFLVVEDEEPDNAGESNTADESNEENNDLTDEKLEYSSDEQSDENIDNASENEQDASADDESENETASDPDDSESADAGSDEGAENEEAEDEYEHMTALGYVRIRVSAEDGTDVYAAADRESEIVGHLDQDTVLWVMLDEEKAWGQLYSESEEDVLSFVCMEDVDIVEKETDDEEETLETEETFTVIDGVYTYTGAGLTVTVETTEENGLPDGADFVVIPVPADTDRVADYVEQAAELNGVDASSIIPYVFDMHFEYDGDEVNIAEGTTVKVNIVYDNAIEMGDVIAVPFYHIVDGKLVTLIQDVTHKEEPVPMRGAKKLMNAKAAIQEVETKTDDGDNNADNLKENTTIETIDFTVDSFSDFMLTGVRGATDVYAMLYSNGDLVFQLGDTADPDKGTVTASWNYGTGDIARDWADAAYKNTIINVYFNTPVTYNAQDLFKQLSNVEYIYNIDNVTLTKGLFNCFLQCSKLKEITGFDSWNLPNSLNLQQAFMGCYELITPLDFSGKTITALTSAFDNCKKITAINLSGCKLSGSAGQAFSGCNALTTLDLSNLSASSVPSYFENAFMDTFNLQYVDLSNVYFDSASNSNLSTVFSGSGVQRVTFGPNKNAGVLLPSGYWVREDTGEEYTTNELRLAWDSSMAGTYRKVSKYAILYSNGDLVFQNSNVPDLTKGAVVEIWDCPGGVTSREWATDAYKNSIKNIYVNTPIMFSRSLYFNNSYFQNLENLEYIYSINNVNLEDRSSLESAFRNCSKLKHIYGLSEWDTHTITSIRYLFDDCNELDNIQDIESWDLAISYSDMEYSFRNCKNLINLDLSSWDLSRVYSINQTFYSCDNLRTVELGNIFTDAITTIDMGSAFTNDYSLETFNNQIFQNVPAGKPVKLLYTFVSCTSLRSTIDLSGITINTLDSTFQSCKNLPYVILSGCTFESSASGQLSFSGCSSLRAVDLSNINYSGAYKTGLNGTFQSTARLAYLDLTSGYFNNGNKSAAFLNGSGISKVKLGSGFLFVNASLPVGNWKRESTGEVYTAAELKAAWNSSMADTYEKVNVVIFDGNGGEIFYPTRLIKQLDEVLEEEDFPSVSRPGYTFLGWYTDQYNGHEVSVGDPITQSIYFARWSKNDYTLVLKKNVESDPTNEEVREDLEYDEVYRLSPDIFTNGNKVIQRWTTNPDGTGTVYGADEKVSMLTNIDNDEVILYAQWGKSQYVAISMNSQGGSPVESLIVEKGSTVAPSQYIIPSREGYTFAGWWTDPTGGERWDATDHVAIESVQLYAHWEKDPVVTFNPNGGGVLSSYSKAVPYGGTLQSLPNGSDASKTLAGFFTSPTFGQGEQLTTSTVITEDVTYYAQWGYQPYFNLNGGKYSTAYSIDTAYPLSESSMIEITSFPDVERDGYTLVRWKLADESTVNIGDVIDRELIPEIIAEWERVDTVTVNFDPGDGSLAMYGGATTSLCYNYEMVKGDELGYYPDAYKAVSNQRLEFLGWYDDNDVLYTPTTVINDDVTLHAKWQDNTRVLYKFVVAGTTYQATSAYNNSVSTVSGNRVTSVYRTSGEEFGILPGLSIYRSGATLNGKYLEGWYSDPDPFELDGTLKAGVEKLTSTTAKTSESTWYAYIVDNVVDKYDNSMSYKYFAEWTNASNADVSNIDNNLDFHPQNSNTQTANLHIHFELNSEVQEALPAGSVRITIPRSVWKDWNGDPTGTTNLSAQLPKYPNTKAGMFFAYAEDENGDYVILNNQQITGGAGVDLTVAYSVSPVNVPGGAIDKDKDYVEGYPYYDATIPVQFEIDKDAVTTYTTVDNMPVLTNAFVADVEETINLTIEMHTFVDTSIKKNYANMYYEWNSSWGDKPADASDYFYISWEIVYGYNNNQPFVLHITEDTVHDGTVVYLPFENTNPDGMSITTGGTRSPLYSSVVTKYPKSLLNNIPATGITLKNQVRLTADWRSGYKTEYVAPAEHTIYSWSYPMGEFNKTNVWGKSNHYSSFGSIKEHANTNPRHHTYSSGQNLLLSNNSIGLQWELTYDGWSSGTPLLWDDTTNTYSRLQRVIALSDGNNNDIMYSSGKPYARYVWEPTTGNIPLTDNDYAVTALKIYIREYDGEYRNGEWGGPTLRDDVSMWKEAAVYVRYRNTDDLVYYTSIKPEKVTDSNDVYGAATIDLPANVVGWEVRYPTSYFRTYMQVNEKVTLYPTADVKSYIQKDYINGYTSIIKNRGYCDIWTSDDVYAEPSGVFFHATDWTGGYNGADKEVYELTRQTGTLKTAKFASQQGNVLFDVERGIQENPMAIKGWNYYSNVMMPLTDGVFYDLLPRGATVDRNSIYGILSSNNVNSYSTNDANYYNNSPSSNKLSKEYYDVEFVENWENSGRTMMIIRFTAPDETTNMATFYYLLRMTYQDVISYGTSVQNDVAFMDITGKNAYESATEGLGVLGDDGNYYERVSLMEDYVAYAVAPTNYIPVDAFSWGFYKNVNTKDGYVQEEVTIPNNIYTYKINYSQSDYATVNSMVFFDVLERGAYDDAFHNPTLNVATEWEGTFDSVDITPLLSLVKDGSTESNPVYCAPVVYYSTKAKNQFTGSDWDTTNTATWTTTMPEKSLITAIAVDCTKASDGTDFVLKGRNSATFYVRMRSSMDPNDVGKDAINQAMFYAIVNDSPTEETSDTVVTLIDEEPEIHKISDPVSGTSAEPTLVGVNDDIAYTISIKNTNTEFTIPNIVVEDEIPNTVQLSTQDVLVHFGNPGNAMPLSESPRASLRTNGNTLVFNINSLEPNESCYFIVPCKARTIGQVIENTAVITSVNGVEKEINSETTYHEVRIRVPFFKTNTLGDMLPGAVLQLWNTDEAEDVLIEEWTSTGSKYTILLLPGNYVLKETQAPSGYELASDIEFEIQSDGTLIFADTSTGTSVTMTDEEIVHVFGTKTWKYDSLSDRPASITVRLMRMIEGDVSPTYAGEAMTVTEQDNWEYDFGNLPKYDNNGYEYIYSVEETPIADYTTLYTSGDPNADGLAITFNIRTSTYNASDSFMLYYIYDGKTYGKLFYGKYGETANPAGATVHIPTNEFWISFEADGSNNDYGFKIDQIVPVQVAVSSLINDRVTPPSWVENATCENFSGGNFPETDHSYSVYDRTLMHYTRNIGGESYDIINVKNTLGYDIPFNKINEDNEQIGGVTLRLTSVPEPGDAEIQPVEWVTVAGESHIEHLYPGHYLLHEVAPAAGYLVAEDIAFVVDGEGNVIIDETTLSSVDMLDKYIDQPYPFKKVWMDNAYESSRPSSVTFNLVRVSDGQTVETVTLTSADADDSYTWSGEFDPVPVVDEHMEPIEYAVREVVNGNDYIVYHDVQNKVGFYITFTDDSDLGTNAYLKIYPLGYSDPDHPGARMGKGALVLDSALNLSSVEGTGMAGKTYFVPILDNVEGFIISKQLIDPSRPDDTVNLEIESIVPAIILEPYSLIGNTGPAVSNIFYGSDYPDLNNTISGATADIHTFIWQSQADTTENIANTSSIDEIVNYINKTEVPFVKMWENENGDTSGRPATVTFNLYNINDTATIVDTMTVSAGTSLNNNYQFTGVPKYNQDGTVAQYIVRETSVSGYHTYYSPDRIFGLLVTFSDTSTAGEGTLKLYTKISNRINTNATLVDYENGSQISAFTGTQMAGKTYYIPVLDPNNPGFVMELTGDTSKTANVSITSVVPVDYYMQTASLFPGAEVEYTVNQYFSGTNYPAILLTETSAANRIVSYEYDMSQGKEVHNFRNVTSIPVTKIWDDETAADRPASITINAYNVNAPDTIVGSVTLTVSDADSGTQWSGTITGLPMYNADGTLAQYVLKEAPTDGYRAVYAVPRGMLVTFSEDSFAGYGDALSPIRLYSVSKGTSTLISNVWSASESSPDISGHMVTGKTFYIPIEEAGSYAFAVYKQSEYYTPIKIESVRLTTQSQAYNHSDSGVQIPSGSYTYHGAGKLDLTDRNGYIVYDFTGVVEQADNGGASIDGIITNEIPHYYVTFNKHSETYNILPGATLQILKASDNTVLDEWESNVYDHEVCLVPGTYILHEDTPPTGFAQADDIEFTLDGEGVLTVNNETVERISMMDNELVEINGQKSWIGDNASQRPASITVNLYQNGQLIDSTTTNAAAEWKYSFADVPRYDENGDPYTYTVSETAIHDYTESVLTPSSSESWITTESEWEMPGTYSVVMEPVITQIPALGYRMVLSSQSRSESTNYDYFYIYYRKDGQLYKISGGQGSASSGRFGGTTLANKTIDIPSNDIYIVWRSDTSQVYWGFQVVDMIPLDTEVTVTATAQTALPATDGNYSFGTPIEYTGTNYPETGHNYANNERIIYHWTGNAFVNGYADAYTVSADNGLLVTFDNEAVTHGENDKLTFYCLVNDTWYVLPTELSGNMNSAQVVIPSRTFVMKWESDSSGTALGWKIDSIVDYANASVPGCQPATLPSGTQNMYQGSRYPEHQHYSNNETVLYRYLGDGLELPVAADRYGYQVTANITNTRMPDKQNYSIYKQRPDTTLLGGATLRITGRETGASIDIEPIQWTSSSNGPQVVQLRAGQYVLHEVTPPPGYLGAADIPFTIDSTGALIINNVTQTAIYMTDLPQTTIAVDKVDYNHQSTSITGAVLRLYDSNSTALTTWTSDGTPHDITEYVTFGNSYRLHEVSAPAGFNIMSEDITVNIASDGTVTLATTEWAVVTGNSVDGYVIKMYNNQGVHFPSTGASDRIWVYLGSVMILLASAALLIRRKRRHSNA